MLAFQIGFRDRQMLGLALGKHLFLQSSLFVFPLYMNTFIFFSRWPDPYRNDLLGGCIVCNGSVTLVHLSTRTINYVDLDRQPTCIMRAKETEMYHSLILGWHLLGSNPDGFILLRVGAWGLGILGKKNRNIKRNAETEDSTRRASQCILNASMFISYDC